MHSQLLFVCFQKKNGWKIPRKSYDKIVYNITQIIKKFGREFKGGISIVIPSGNPLNRWIANLIIQELPSIQIMDDVLVKLTTGDILAMVDSTNSAFYKYYRKRGIDSALRALKGYLKRMDEQRDGYFTRHFVNDPKMRDVLDLTIKLSDTIASEDAQKINQNNILIIDDSISRGQTVKEAIQIIKDNFNPKSISVITLFSKQYPI